MCPMCVTALVGTVGTTVALAISLVVAKKKSPEAANPSESQGQNP